MTTTTKLAELPAVTLINPWSGVQCQMMTWAQIRRWATHSIHQSNRAEWLDSAREAFRDQDGDTLGSMIIGS
jgi:cytochrome b subunit of formate dehydrogenase